MKRKREMEEADIIGIENVRQNDRGHLGASNSKKYSKGILLTINNQINIQNNIIEPKSQNNIREKKSHKRRNCLSPDKQPNYDTLTRENKKLLVMNVEQQSEIVRLKKVLQKREEVLLTNMEIYRNVRDLSYIIIYIYIYIT